MTIPELFDLIKNTAGTNKKKEILANNLTPVVQQIFEDTYSDKKYFVKKYNVTKSGTKTVDENYKDFAECLFILSNRYKTGNAAVSLVEHTINQFEPKSQEILKGILAKKLTIGISRENFLNATGVESEKLDKFLVSLAFNLDKVKGVDPVDGSFFASRKLDGCRCITIATRKSDIGDDKYDIKFMSRQGKEFKTLGNVKPAIEAMLDHIFSTLYSGGLSKYMEANSIVFDGELCILDEKGDEHFDWAVSAISRKDYTIPTPCYNIFDILTLDEFNMENPSSFFSVRDAYLTHIFSQPYIAEFKTIKHVKQERITCQDDFDRWSQYVKDGGWEGFMLRKDAPYKNDRTKDLLKVKKFSDAEYVVEAVETGKVVYNEGGNKEYDVVTAIIIDHKGSKVGVGSGISKEQRIAWFKDPSLIIGKTVTVQYFEETKNKNNDMLSLRFPVLKYVYENGRDS